MCLASCLLLPAGSPRLFLLAPPAYAAPPTPVASYTIEVTLDAEAKTLAAHEVITYVNTTADPIPDLVFHLYLNAFRDRDSLFLQESGLGHRGYGWAPEHPGWVQVTAVELGDGTPLTLEEIEDGTLARADLPRPVAPGESVEVELDFHAQLPRVFARTGYAGDFFMVGQWFPKLGVWEDGAWNAHPFHANAEFYADFGTYDVSITLPTGYVTGGTGLPISTVDNGDGTQTVHYHAEDVIDFAWTASPHFQEATRQIPLPRRGEPEGGGDGVELLYLYLPEHEWTVERILDAAEAAVSLYSGWYGPYPYSRLTVVDVPDDGQGAGGMEYPTLVTAGAMSVLGLGEGLARGEMERSLEVVVVHEIGHQWWQSVVAFNEAEEPWLDEGFTDYSAVRAMAAAYGADTSLVDAGNFEMGYLDMRRAEYLSNPRVPMYGRAWDFRGMEYGVAAYSKPVIALTTLERTLGEGMMLDIMGSFFQRYQFAHPTTEDFRAVAEEISGQDLSWFFDGLVYGDGALNYTVTDVGAHSVTVARQGDVVIPTEVLVTFADGSTVLEQWDGRETQMTFTYPDRPPVRSAEVDPERKLVLDLRWADNGLSRRLEVSPWLALVTRLLYNGRQWPFPSVGGLTVAGAGHPAAIQHPERIADVGRAVAVNGWDALRIGISRATRYRWVLLILFAVNLASALSLAVLPALGLAAELGHRPAIHRAADGVDAWLVVETLMSPLSETALGEEATGPESLVGLATVAALPLLAWLPAAFLSGGVLLTYAEALPCSGESRTSPFHGRRFLWGCWHWFGAFLLLGAVQGVASILLFISAIGVAAGAVAAVGGWLTWIVAPLLMTVAALWLALFEYTRIVAVVGGTRNIARAFGRAVGFVFRHPLPVAGLYGLALLLLGLVHALYRWGLMPYLPLDWWPLVLVVQQAFVLARLWARLVRLAGGVALYRMTNFGLQTPGYKPQIPNDK